MAQSQRRSKTPSGAHPAALFLPGAGAMCLCTAELCRWVGPRGTGKGPPDHDSEGRGVRSEHLSPHLSRGPVPSPSRLSHSSYLPPIRGTFPFPLSRLGPVLFLSPQPSLLSVLARPRPPFTFHYWFTYQSDAALPLVSSSLARLGSTFFADRQRLLFTSRGKQMGGDRHARISLGALTAKQTLWA